MPKRPYAWRVDAQGCHKFDNADLGFAPSDQTAHFPVFLHLRVTNLPGVESIMCSSQAQPHRLERAATKKDRMRLRERLAQQAVSNTQTLSSAAPNNTPPQPQHLFFHATTRWFDASAPGVNDFQCFIAAWDAAVVSMATPGVYRWAHYLDFRMRFVPPFPSSREMLAWAVALPFLHVGQ